MMLDETPRALVDGPSLALEEFFQESAQFAMFEEDLEGMKLDVVAMTTLLRSLSFAIAVNSVESYLKEEDEDAGPPVPPMSEDDWMSYV